MSGCIGECCRTITLSFSPERIAQIAACYRQSLAHGGNTNWDGHDAVYVTDNFIPLRRSYVDGINKSRWPDGNQPRMQYRCRNWTGSKCGDYANRPRFCREFGEPGEVQCGVQGCGYSAARAASKNP